MRANINLNTLSQRLKLQISARGMELLKEKARVFILKVHQEAKDWKVDIRRRLTKLALTRGRWNGRANPNGRASWLNLHNSSSMNDSFPMRVSGKLRDALRYRVTQRSTKDAVVVTVKRWFEETISKSGVDYGEVLNTRHHLLRGYKERAYDMLDKRLRSIR